MNIYVKQISVSVTKVTMASFEMRFLTIKVTKFASTEAEVLVITMVIPEIVGMYIFIYGLLFANFVMIFSLLKCYKLVN